MAAGFSLTRHDMMRRPVGRLGESHDGPVKKGHQSKKHGKSRAYNNIG
jgi:hypothetical protein